MSDEKKEIKNNKPSEVIASSLRFPSVLLDFCLEKIKILFDKNSKSAMSVESIGEDLGYSITGGKGASVLAALKYYGLLVKEGNAYKVADFVIDYCIESELNHEVIFTCLSSVPVNKKLFSTFDFKSLPGENVIKSFLIKECKYNLKQATDYIETFKKNKTFYDNNCKEKTLTAHPVLPVSADTPTQPVTEVVVNQNNSVVIKNSVITYPISDNRNVIINLPCDLKDLAEDDLEDIKDILELVLRKVVKQIDLKKKEI